MENPTFRRRGLSPAQRRAVIALQWLAAIVAGAAFLALFLWVLPALLTLHPRVTGAARHLAISNATIGIASVLAVLGTVGGFAYTIRTYRLSRTGQIADRYTKAIEQLANSSGDIRIGGIYALAQTARDAAEYQDTVTDVLVAYVRNRSPWQPHTPAAPRPGRWRSRDEEAAAVLPEPQPDIRVALDVLRRLVDVLGKKGLDFRHTNLAGADLIEMYLLDAKFAGANLTQAKLSYADMRGADLRGAELGAADLYQADFTDVKLLRGQISLPALKNVKGLQAIQWSEPSTASDGPPLLTWPSASRREDRPRRSRRPNDYGKGKGPPESLTARR